MKKLALLLAAAMLLSLLGCASLRPVNPVSDFDYYVNEEKQYINITKYIGESKDVVIPAYIEDLPVRTIGIDSFANSSIESVVLPDTVEEVLDNAFDGCEMLKTIQFSANLKKICTQAFRKCSKLKKVLLPQGLSIIGPEAFAYCGNVTEVYIPGSVEVIGHSAFGKTYALSTLTIEEGVSTLGQYGTFIDADALKKVTIPSSVETLGEACFAGCTGLEEVIFLGDAPEDVGDLVFEDTSEKLKLYYDPNTSGWDSTPLSQYNLVAK